MDEALSNGAGRFYKMQNEKQVSKVHSLKQARCSTCGLSSLCLPVSLNMTEMERLDSIIDKSRPLKKGEHLFRQGDKFSSVYAIRAGSVKIYTLTDLGDEQITGFFFPGDLVGLSAYDTSIYPVSAKILETTTVCEIPFQRLDELSSHMPELRRQILKTMSREICNDQQMMMLLAKKSAEQRVASFLLKLSQRFQERGYSASYFRLSMSRSEIGNYLGLAVETISRVFTRFQSLGLISVDGKEVNILNGIKLHEHSGELKENEYSCANHFS